MTDKIERTLDNARHSCDRLQLIAFETVSTSSSSSSAVNVPNCDTTSSTSAEAQLSSQTALRRLHVSYLRNRFSAT